MAIIQTRVRLKKDTSEDWEDNGSLVLLDGEMAIEGDRNYKIGDGTTEWADLPYANSNPVLITVSSLTLNASHAECFLSCYTSIRITIPASFVPVGTQIEIYNRFGNTITLLTSSGVTINGKLTSTTDYEVLTLKQVDTNTWLSYTNTKINVQPLKVTENGIYTAPEGKAYSPITVNVGEEPEIADVNFRDYDGTLLYTYNKSEFLSLEAMPSNPVHDGLTAQGWNWSLADAKAYVNTYGKLDIGQMYITDDGKTRLYVHLEKGRLHPYVGFGINGTATIDWGDGTTSTVTGSRVSTLVYGNHEYTNEGNYVIAIDGNINIIGASSGGGRMFCKDANSSATSQYVYLNCIQKIELGNIYGIGNNAFWGCSSLASITIPNNITRINSYAFYYCYSLASITIPNSVTSIDTYAFRECPSLALVIIPTSVTGIYNNAFYACYSLASITIPDGATSIGTNVFYNCYSLASITISNGATSISASIFRNCYSLTSITIPNSVTSISTYAFNNCYGLGEIHFKSTTPPTVSGSNAWTGIPTDCKIYVPQGTLSAYKSATNYPNSSTYTYIEE